MTKKKKTEEPKAKKLEEKLKEKDEKINELTDTLQRLQAEFENATKRMEKEKQQFMEYSNAKLIEEFLPILESFDNANQNINKIEFEKKEEIVNGVKLIHNQFVEILKKHGIEEMQTLGKKFDPQYHEALLQEKDENKEDQTILEEFQKGYLFKGKVLRSAKVKINKK